MTPGGMTQYVLTFVVSFLSDFLVTGGSTYTAAMIGAGSTQVPTRAALILALVAGLVAGGRRLQALISPPPLAPPAKNGAAVVLHP